MFIQDYLVMLVIEFCHWQHVLWLCECLGLIELPKQITASSDPVGTAGTTSPSTEVIGSYGGDNNDDDDHLGYGLVCSSFEGCVRKFKSLRQHPEVVAWTLVAAAAAVFMIVIPATVRCLRYIRRPRKQPYAKQKKNNNHNKELTGRASPVPPGHRRDDHQQQPAEVVAASLRGGGEADSLLFDQSFATESSSSIGSSYERISDTIRFEPGDSTMFVEQSDDDDETYFVETNSEEHSGDYATSVYYSADKVLNDLLPCMTVAAVLDVGRLFRMLSVQNATEIQENVFQLECIPLDGQLEVLRLAVTPVTLGSVATIQSEVRLLERIRRTLVGAQARERRHLPIIREVVALRDNLAKLRQRSSVDSSYEPVVRDYVAVVSVAEVEVAPEALFKGSAPIPLLISVLEQANFSLASLRRVLPGLTNFHRLSLVSWPIDVDFDIDGERHVVVDSQGILVKHCPELLHAGIPLSEFRLFTSTILQDLDSDPAKDASDIQYCARVLFSLGATTPLRKLLDWRKHYLNTSQRDEGIESSCNGSLE